MLVLKFIMGFGFGFILALLTEHDDPAENMGIHAMIYGVFATIIIILQTGGLND